MEYDNNALVPAIVPNANEATMNITWSGQNGDMPDPIPFDATDADLKAWATEAVQNGDIPGISADHAVNFENFEVQRFNATDTLPNRVFVRPKTPFGR